METTQLTLPDLLNISTMPAEDFQQFTDIDCENIAAHVSRLDDARLVSPLDLAFMNRTAVLMDGLRRRLSIGFRAMMSRECTGIVEERHAELKPLSRERFDKIVALLDIRRADLQGSV